MNLKELVSRMTRETYQRNFFCRLDNEHVLGETLRTEGVKEGEGYFRIRLTEMFLHDKRRWWVGFNPMAIAVTDFIYDNVQKSLPIYIGNQLLQSIEKELDGQHVEYRNTNIIGPATYCGGDVALFIGLFRVQVNDFSRQLFDFLETIIGTFKVTQLGTYMSFAESISKGLYDLLGLKEVQLQVGHRNVFNSHESGSNSFREGYFVSAACPSNELDASTLWVRDGILQIGKSQDDLKPFNECDFCLVRIEQFEERNDYQSLSFHSLWKMSLEALYKGTLEEADRIFLSLIREVAISADLTRKQRFRLVQLYKANYEKEIEVFKGVHAAPLASASRGGRILLDAPAVIQKTAYSARKRNFDPDVQKGLIDVSRNLDKIIGGRTYGPDMSESDITTQMECLAAISTSEPGDPQALADAIVIDTLDPS